MIAATRLRGGNAASARGAARFAAEVIGTARDCGCTGTIIVRLDSAFYNAAVIGTVRRGGAIGEDAWTPIRYPRAIWDDQLRCWISDAEVTETGYTAFASKKGRAVTDRLIVCRVRDLNKKAAAGQDELFPVWRYHAVFTDSPFVLVSSRRAAPRPRRRGAGLRRRHQRTLAHLPSGISPRMRPGCRSRPWRTICCARPPPWRPCRSRRPGPRPSAATAAARTARHGRGHLTLHLPEGWHREHEGLNLLAACGPPAAAA